MLVTGALVDGERNGLARHFCSRLVVVRSSQCNGVSLMEAMQQRIDLLTVTYL